MAHHIRFFPILGIATLAIVANATGLNAGQPAAAAAAAAATPPTVGPVETEKEILCRLLKALKKPCPSENFVNYEDFYAQTEVAWAIVHPDDLNPQQRDELLAATLAVYNSQTPAPAGVDPAAHDRFILVLDEILYEMGA